MDADAYAPPAPPVPTVEATRPAARKRSRMSRTASADPYDVETWDPRKLTYRGWFFTIVVILNLLVYGASFALMGWIATTQWNRLPAPSLFAGYALLLVATLVSLCFLWFRWKWAAIAYLALGLVFTGIAFVQTGIGGGVFQGVLHLALVGYAVKTRWKPRYIPSHLREKFAAYV